MNKPMNTRYIWLLFIGLVASYAVQAWREGEVTHQAREVMTEVTDNISEMGDEEYEKLMDLISEVRGIILSKLTAQDAERAEVMMVRMNEQTATYEEMAEWAVLEKKAKDKFTPEEAEKFSVFAKRLSQMTSNQKIKNALKRS